MGKLTARKVETAKPGKYGDGGGLQLAVAAPRAKKWVLRFLWQGKAREMGLGSYPEVGLAEAREKAMAGRRLARSGIDPIAERKQDRRVPTFGKLADEVVAEQSKGFRNEKHTVAILNKMNEARTGDHIFPGWVRGRPLSVMAMGMVLRRMDEQVTVHGFRSSFRDWAGNETHFPRELAEAALAHVVGDKAEQAYRRSDALEKRRALMEAWAQWCEPREAADNVTPLRRNG